MSEPQTGDHPATDMADLRRRLAETEAILDAIREGARDAMSFRPLGERAHALHGAEQPYRALIEQMQQGAATISAEGLILYANRRLAETLRAPHERLLASSIRPYVPSTAADLFQSVLEEGCLAPAEAEMRLRALDGTLVPVYIAISPLDGSGGEQACLVVTDLTQQKRGEEILAQERLARSILENAAEAIVVCDAGGRIVRASAAATRLCGHNPLFQPLADAFPLVLTRAVRENEEPGAEAPGPVVVAAALRGETLTGVEGRFVRRDGRTVDVLITAGPLRSQEEGVLGCVVTLADITAYKRAEVALLRNKEHIEALNERLRRTMYETHHRVKNNLQVIAALLDLHVLSGAEMVRMDELRRIGHHIRSLAAIHDILTHQSRERKGVEVLHAREAIDKLRPLLQGIVGDADVRFHVDDLRLPVRQATALAVLVNELLSNAAKHGRGQIALSLTVCGPAARLEVTDSGPGFPPEFDPRRRGSTGFELIDSLSSWDLGGSFAVENRPEGGARVVVSFPVSEGDGEDAAPPA
ncbi:MAG: PAS domain S-box protein [Chthonomonadales bacterium]|nr:PAS domain S-box protein [Chthonomonadales bacterium]